MLHIDELIDFVLFASCFVDGFIPKNVSSQNHLYLEASVLELNGLVTKCNQTLILLS